MGEPATLRAVVYGRESKDKTKSIDDQVSIGADTVAEHGWQHAGSYDDGTSASRYATKPRPGWDRLLTDLDAGAFDVLVLWETTRGDRTLSSWATLLDVCRERGVRIHVVSDERTYDPRRSRDYRDLATAGVDGSYEADRIADRAVRGHLAAAKSGRPAMGRTAFGYRRVYDPSTGELAGQEPDPEAAPIVRDIYDQVVRMVPVSTIAKGLDAAGVKPPGGAPSWHRSRVRELVKNPVYAGLRRHRHYGRRADTSATFPGRWAPLVTEETWRTAQRILSAEGRTTTRRPGAVAHLLSYLAVCYRGHPLRAKRDRYMCPQSCVAIRQDWLDDLVTATVLEALADPKVYHRLRQVDETTGAQVQAARDEAARLRADLDDWRRSATDGRGTTPETLAVVEADLTRKITAAEARADAAELPPALRPFLTPGADVEARWEAATLPARREVIRALMTVTVHPAPYRGAPAAERVTIEPGGAR